MKAANPKFVDADVVRIVEAYLDRTRFPSNEWIKFKMMGLYFRRSKRLSLAKGITDCLDLANIELNMRLPALKRAWLFMQAIASIEHVCEKRGLLFLVENVHTPAIACFMRHRGYRETFDDMDVPSYSWPAPTPEQYASVAH